MTNIEEYVIINSSDKFWHKFNTIILCLAGRAINKHPSFTYNAYYTVTVYLISLPNKKSGYVKTSF